MTGPVEAFAALHRRGDPLLLYNAWDVGSAAAVERAGAPAVATGSHSLAGALGFGDGEEIPLALFYATIARILDAVECPVSADFEGGFAHDADEVGQNASKLAAIGAAGCNFEDQVIAGEGLHGIAEQALRIAAVSASGIFVNARTDLFLQALGAGRDPNDAALLPEALERAAAYGEAGARCFFVPGLSDADLLARLCSDSALPVSVMMMGEMDIARLTEVGVVRISWGPAPWRRAMQQLEADARALYAR